MCENTRVRRAEVVCENTRVRRADVVSVRTLVLDEQTLCV